MNIIISSLIDTWIILRDKEIDGERVRELLILKSRGMSHSNKVCRYNITGKGIVLDDNEKSSLRNL